MNDQIPTALAPPSPEALFRYTVLSQVIARELGGEPRAKAITAVAAQDHPTLQGTLRQVSARSLYRWLAAFETHGFDGLMRKARSPLGGSRVLDPGLMALFEEVLK